MAKAQYSFSTPCLQCVHWMTSRSQTWPKMCLCELMNWFNCLPNLRAAKSNKLKFTILWSHLQGDNTATVYFVRCWSESGENYSPYIILIIINIIKNTFNRKHRWLFCSVNLHYCSSPSGCQLAGQGVLIPWRPSWLHSHSSSQQLHTQGLIIALAVAQQHPWEDPQGQMMLHRAMERDGRGRRCQDAPGRAQPRSPEGAGGAGRWEQQLCSAWKSFEPRSLPRDGGARSALITPAAVSQTGGRARQAQGHIPAALAHALGTPHGQQLVSAQPCGSGSAPAVPQDGAAEP